jgi:adenylate cyclase
LLEDMSEPVPPLPEKGSEAAQRILGELDRIIDKGLSDSSDRQRSLLRYLVTEEVEGRGDRLKAYSIATDVFGRSADFDAQQDSIVRVEIGRLRKSLELYYATAGRLDPMRISVEKGQYRPSFEMREPFVKAGPVKASPVKASGGGRRWLTIVVGVAVFFAGVALWATRSARETEQRTSPRIAIAPFSFAADRPGQDYIGAGLRAELVSTLSEFQWLSVFPITRSVDLVAGEKPTNWRVDFLVRANVQISGDTVTVAPVLLDGATGAVRWSRRYEAPFRADAVNALQHDIATRIAADVGQPFGVVADLELTRASLDEFHGDEAFRCSLRALQFWSTYRREDYAPAEECASRLGGAASADSNMQAVLALLKLDGARYGFDAAPRETLLAQADELGSLAYRRSPRASLPRAAHYSSALCSGDMSTFRVIAGAAVRDSPNNPAVLLDVGAKMALGAGDWTEGLDLVARARNLTSNVPNWFDIAETVDALKRHREISMKTIHFAALETDHPLLLLVDLAVQVEQKQPEAASVTSARLSQLGYDGEAKRMALLDNQCWSKPVKDALKSFLVEAKTR